MVSVLAFYSDDPSSNPAEVYNFSVKLLLKRTKINKKRPGLAHFFKKKTDKRLVHKSKVFIQLRYKGITTVYVWQISDA